MNDSVLTVHTDGGARGNPGPGASAFVAELDGRVVEKGSEYLGITTNNQAEYNGALLALNWILGFTKNQKLQEIIFYLDSELIVKQLNGVYKIKDKKLIALFIRVNNLIKELNIRISFKHVPRTQNKVADFLVNQKLDEESKK